ncbi:hypothetical protein HMPREF9163_02020 [Selenomonas sp. oral taxon 138 str. F0429]|nr:hypothetical protein HMPREF9163_02020 [Selenomonas sp. oral taxon 138 str. F0429]
MNAQIPSLDTVNIKKFRRSFSKTFFFRLFFHFLFYSIMAVTFIRVRRCKSCA